MPNLPVFSPNWWPRSTSPQPAYPSPTIYHIPHHWWQPSAAPPNPNDIPHTRWDHIPPSTPQYWLLFWPRLPLDPWEVLHNWGMSPTFCCVRLCVTRLRCSSKLFAVSKIFQYLMFAVNTRLLCVAGSVLLLLYLSNVFLSTRIGTFFVFPGTIVCVFLYIYVAGYLILYAPPHFVIAVYDFHSFHLITYGCLRFLMMSKWFVCFLYFIPLWCVCVFNIESLFNEGFYAFSEFFVWVLWFEVSWDCPRTPQIL